MAAPFRSPNDRPVLGCIGTGDRWNAVGPQAMNFSDCAAVCDVDRNHVEKGRETALKKQSKPGAERTVEMFEDYRKLLDRKDIDVVTIVTPDHWHSKIAIEALRAGKDVYCEKPLTLTIDEGKQIRKVLEETKRVFQVGTQQRSEMALRFLHAVAMVREGRIGELKTVTCAIGGAPSSGEIPVAEIPKELNWDMWLGQAPLTDYRFKATSGRYGNSRCHYEFRWWYEYSGGKMTDWGAHHVDIAAWAFNLENTGPVKVEPVSAVHPVAFKDGMPTDPSQYNTATQFHVTATFKNGAVLHIRDSANDLGFDNGLLLEGTTGRIFVNRGKLTGDAVDALKTNPLKEETLKTLYKGKTPGNHMQNFFECIGDRTQPISDVHSHHRAMTVCHLANIAIRLDRTIQWDPDTEQIVNDPQAATWQAREQRKGYEIQV
ncbi:MAG: Gfo/Idh/MocA family protein [Planctomyces sp.]